MPLTPNIAAMPVVTGFDFGPRLGTVNKWRWQVVVQVDNCEQLQGGIDCTFSL